jgi:hypothetical protein
MAHELSAESIGPVEFAVFGFEGDRFDGRIAAAILDLVDAGTVRVIDLAFIRKGANGDVDVVEAVDSDVADAFAALTDGASDLLNHDELAAMADGLPPATAAAVIVWENRWAAKLGAAIRESGGFLIARETVPRENVVAAIDALSQA